MRNKIFAQIAVNKKAVRNKSFTYRIPKYMSPKEGSLVLVPFHGQRVVGVINSISKEKQTSAFKIKQIESVIYSQNLFWPKQLKLARFIAQKYYAPFSSVIFAMLPHYLRNKKRPIVISKQQNYPQTKSYNLKPKKYLLFDPQNKYTLSIYQKAIETRTKNNQVVLFLVPDLDLAIVKTVKNLSKKSIVLSSEKTNKETFTDWQKIKNGHYNLIIGSHLALFAPINNLGLIIVHHENDPFYKNEQLPKYHLREVALELARLSHASIILQSQTPSLESLSYLQKNGLKLIPFNNLKVKFGLQSRQNPIKIIDLKQERGLISYTALNRIENNLKKGKKTLLFLNRKGFARFFICQDCGFSKHLSSLEPAPAICPQCSGTNTQEHSFGTRRLEYETKKLFPRARILRLDKENKEIKNLKLKIENSDVVIATSYIFKFELNFDTVIIVLAEIGLYLPDFRSQESLFSTLIRALSFGKEKIIQTFYPENLVIKSILADSYNDFSNLELKTRKNLYPPFTTLIRLTIENKSKKIAQKEATLLAKNLKRLNQSENRLNQVFGPSPVFIQPKNKTKMEIIIKGKDPYPLLSLVPDKWKVDVDPIELLK